VEEKRLVLAGKYLTFRLGEEAYGIEILKAQEIIGMTKVTQVPRTPPFVRGVVNLRGKVVPVIDLPLKFGLESREDTDRTCIIVAQVGGQAQPVTLGVIVDEVSEVLDVSADQIEDAPSFGSDVDTDFILGMGKIGENVIMLIDVDKALSDSATAIAGSLE
jgi:purine-binding chemotaxis protein CheW